MLTGILATNNSHKNVVGVSECLDESDPYVQEKLGLINETSVKKEDFKLSMDFCSKSV